jgi:diadenosine tetraphosphate (Ap4A) HIT family hydrolase
MTPIPIDPRLLNGTHQLAELALCTARLQDDARFPWIVLIPRRAGKRELEDLSQIDQVQLLAEITRTGAAVRAMGEALGRPVEKLNVGALGNVVPQLHVHVLGRRADDEAWPQPVWGRSPPKPYAQADLAKALAAARKALGV